MGITYYLLGPPGPLLASAAHTPRNRGFAGFGNGESRRERRRSKVPGLRGTRYMFHSFPLILKKVTPSHPGVRNTTIRCADRDGLCVARIAQPVP